MNIVDVDFRWVRRNLDPSGHYDEPRVETVMQWRKKIHIPKLNNQNIPPFFQDWQVDSWTEWEDVRTEEE
jgi:hypothetical protein